MPRLKAPLTPRRYNFRPFYDAVTLLDPAPRVTIEVIDRRVGTGYLPRPAATIDAGGVVIGGTAVYIVKDKLSAEKTATWKFVQWLVQPKQQAAWHVATGYYPVRKESYDLAEVVENTKKYPQFTTAIEQLRASKQTIATAGAVMGPFTQARQYIGTATEETFLGKLAAKAALDKATDEINKALDLYNASVR